MSLSKSQHIAYFSGFRQPRTEVEKIGPWKALCEIRGWNPKDDPKRYEAHESLGLPASTKDWNNGHLNKFLGHVERAWAAHHKTAAPDLDRERASLLHSLRALDLAEPYLKKLAADAYGLPCYWELDLASLRKLLMTAKARDRVQAARAEPPTSAARTIPAPAYLREQRPHQDGRLGFVLVTGDHPF